MRPTDRFCAKMRARTALSKAEEDALARMASGTVRHKPNDILVETGDKPANCLLIVEGLACRFKDLSDGRRQILELNVPGDFIDLHGFVLDRLDHSIMTLTPCTIATVPHEAIHRITETMPNLTRLLWLQTVLDAAIHREWVLSLGQRSALGRLAQFFCELLLRLRLVGLADGLSFDLPLTQTVVADIVGLTPIHVSRTMKALREAGLLTFKRGRVEIHDWDGLRARAEFDPTYLNLPPESLVSA